MGDGALQTNTTGSNNIALGVGAGTFLPLAITILTLATPGVTGEANTIRIGCTGNDVYCRHSRGNDVKCCYTGADRHCRSVRYDEVLGPIQKKEIKPMDSARTAELRE